MRMRPRKRRKGEAFRKWFEGVHCGKQRRCDGEADDVKKGFCCKVEIVYI